MFWWTCLCFQKKLKIEHVLALLKRWMKSYINVFLQVFHFGIDLYISECLKCIQGEFYVALWSIWNWRNMVNLAPTQLELEKAKGEDIFPRIHHTSLLWLQNRSRYRGVNWDDWLLRTSTQCNTLLIFNFNFIFHL